MTEDKCPTCGANFVKKLAEDGGAITYYECGHRKKVVVVNEILTISEQVEIQKYTQTDLVELYSELGRLQDPTKRQYKVAAVEDDKKKGLGRLEKYTNELRKKLCEELGICKKIDKYNKLEVTAQIAFVATALQSYVFETIPNFIPLILLAAIITKIGLGKFCNCS